MLSSSAEYLLIHLEQGTKTLGVKEGLYPEVVQPQYRNAKRVGSVPTLSVWRL